MQDQTSRALLQQGVQYCYPEQEQIKCPRCDSTNTKFCYYNNYNLSQPRHFCKACRRYWTKGGSLRNVPVGGGTRRKSSSSSKRASSSKRSGTQQSTSPPTTTATNARDMGPGSGQDPTRVDGLGFGSLLAGGQFGGVSEGFGSGSGSGSGQDPGLRVGGGEVGQEGCLESGEWGNSNGWPDLAIFTPDSGFH